MDDRLIQRTRYLLRARFRRAQSGPSEHFALACLQLMAWLRGHPVLSGVLEHLEPMAPTDREVIDEISRLASEDEDYAGDLAYGATDLEEHAAVCYHVVSALAAAAEERRGSFRRHLNLATFLRCGDQVADYDSALETLRDVALDGMFEFLDEQLDARNAVLGLLLKYKQSAEWFRRERLRFAADNGLEGRTGERALAHDLYEYMLAQGVDFWIEPRSGSGQVDLVLRVPEGRYVVIDAKYINARTGAGEIRRTLRSGFHQVARYCDDYNEAAGYLVAFVRAPERISIDLDESDGFRFLRVGGRVVYFESVNIQDAPPASKSGKATVVEIAKNQLLDVDTDDWQSTTLERPRE